MATENIDISDKVIHSENVKPIENTKPSEAPDPSKKTEPSAKPARLQPRVFQTSETCTLLADLCNSYRKIAKWVNDDYSNGEIQPNSFKGIVNDTHVALAIIKQYITEAHMTKMSWETFCKDASVTKGMVVENTMQACWEVVRALREGVKLLVNIRDEKFVLASKVHLWGQEEDEKLKNNIEAIESEAWLKWMEEAKKTANAK